MKKLLSRETVFSVGVVLVGFCAVVAPALAATNPSGTGQPGADCEASTTAPQGFSTDGFIHAKTVYAGSDGTPSLANGNSHAVSQYDVACYQLSN